MTTATSPQLIPAEPFRAWLDALVEQHGAGNAVSLTGLSGRTIRRIRRENKELVEASIVEQALQHEGSLTINDLYVTDDPELEPDATCERCHDVVTPIDGKCPWCDGPVTDEVRAKRWCRFEDKLVTPNHQGNCWRCEHPTAPIPWGPCACGCGRVVRLFSTTGRRQKYANGHEPHRSLATDEQQLSVEPIREVLLERVRNLDPIAAVAQQHQIGHEALAAILGGRVETMSRREVREILARGARRTIGSGQDQGPLLGDLYPEVAAEGVCVCGRSKTRSAQYCYACAMRNKPRRGSLVVGEDVLQEGYELYRQGRSAMEVARILLPRSRSRNAESLAGAFRREWSFRGWRMRDRWGRWVDRAEDRAA